MRKSTFVAIALTLVGCGEASRPVEPVSASLSLSASSAPGRAIKVNMLDACDAATFNAAIGAGTCSRKQGMPFDNFIKELTNTQSAGAWHFAPMNLTAQVGGAITAYNDGGEVHTFTKVAQFGGGIVPLLNQLAGTPIVAPECLNLAPSEFVPPGGSDPEAPFTAVGTVKFMCCIHPWMKTTVQVKSTGS
jgi:plastocyanin